MAGMEEWPFHNSSACVIALNLEGKKSSPLVALCLGAHSDDIEIGCGGTLLRFKGTLPGLKLHWVVFSAQGIRGHEAAKSADLFTAGCEKEIVLKDYRDGFLPYVPEAT